MKSGFWLVWNPLVCLHIFQVCSVRSSHSGDSWPGWKSVHAGGVHGICVIPESFLRSLLMMTRPDMVGRCCSLMRIALRSSFVHLEASLCRGKVRTHSCCARSISSPVHNRCMNTNFVRVTCTGARVCRALCTSCAVPALARTRTPHEVREHELRVLFVRGIAVSPFFFWRTKVHRRNSCPNQHSSTRHCSFQPTTHLHVHGVTDGKINSCIAT